MKRFVDLVAINSLKFTIRKFRGLIIRDPLKETKSIFLAPKNVPLLSERLYLRLREILVEFIKKYLYF